MFVEFLGIPRERAGVSDVELEAETLGKVLELLATRFPGLSELIPAGTLHPSVAANLNAQEFIHDPETPLAREDRLLILSADVGG
jgi:molybdopterin converting factor small subunit